MDEVAGSAPGQNLPPTERPIGAGGALIGVVDSPKVTFERIARAKSWSFLIPYVVLLVLTAVSSWVFTKRADMEAFTRDQIQRSPFASRLTPEQIDEAAKQAAQRPPAYAVVTGTAGIAILLVLVAVVFWLAMMAVGGSTGFLGAWRTVCWAQIPTILRTAVATAMMYVKDPTYMDMQNPVATNLGAILGRDALPAPLYSLLSSLDIVTFWMLWLYVLGLSAEGQVSKGRTSAVVFGLYGVVVIIGIGWSLFFR
ncbi:MAG: YIP1 family protein [Acidobacteria bacterium]|nr:YIP1 family protein [Acidobacteriota bacterium]